MTATPNSSPFRFPFKHIPDISSEASRQIRRNFEAIQTQYPLRGTTFFVATSTAYTWETERADFVLTGTDDHVLINQIIRDHPDCIIQFSSGGIICGGPIIATNVVGGHESSVALYGQTGSWGYTFIEFIGDGTTYTSYESIDPEDTVIALIECLSNFVMQDIAVSNFVGEIDD